MCPPKQCCCCAIYEGTKIWTIVLLILTCLGVLGSLGQMAAVESMCEEALKGYATEEQETREFADKCYNMKGRPIESAQSSGWASVRSVSRSTVSGAGCDSGCDYDCSDYYSVSKVGSALTLTPRSTSLDGTCRCSSGELIVSDSDSSAAAGRFTDGTTVNASVIFSFTAQRRVTVVTGDSGGQCTGTYTAATSSSGVVYYEQVDNPGESEGETIDDLEGYHFFEALKNALSACIMSYILWGVLQFKGKALRDTGFCYMAFSVLGTFFGVIVGAPLGDAFIPLMLNLWYGYAVFSLGQQVMDGTITAENRMGAAANVEIQMGQFGGQFGGHPQIIMQPQMGMAVPVQAMAVPVQGHIVQAQAMPVQAQAMPVHGMPVGAQAFPQGGATTGAPVAQVTAVAKP